MFVVKHAYNMSEHDKIEISINDKGGFVCVLG